MKKIRSYVLPISIVLGLLLHRWCAVLNEATPYLIFAILLLNFAPTRFKGLRVEGLDYFIAGFQIIVSLGGYLLISHLSGNEIVAQGFMNGVLCPVAASVAVVSCLLGANRERVVTYTLIGNLLIAIAAPVIFSFIGLQQDMPFMDSFRIIFMRIAPIIALPLLLAIFLQQFAPKVNDVICCYKDWSFYMWAFVLFVTLGKTFDSIFLHGKGNEVNIMWMGILSLVMCGIQFGLGKYVGSKYGDTIAGGQLLGQKNAAVGIWMAMNYLNPLSATFLAFYSIWQNVFNSWQMWKFGKKPSPVRPQVLQERLPDGDKGILITQAYNFPRPGHPEAGDGQGTSNIETA